MKSLIEPKTTKIHLVVRQESGLQTELNRLSRIARDESMPLGLLAMASINTTRLPSSYVPTAADTIASWLWQLELHKSRG